MTARVVTRALALVVLLVVTGFVVGGRLPAVVSRAVAAPAKDFTVTAQPLSVSVQRGQTAAFTVTLTPVNGFNGTVSLAASGLNTGTTAAFASSNLQLNAGAKSTTLTVTTSSSTPIGSDGFTVTGTSGSTKRTLELTVVVSAPTPPGLAVSATPATVTVAPGSTATYSISVTRVNGYSGTVALATAASLPAGVTVSLSTASFAAGTTSPLTATLVATTSGSTPSSTTNITVTATGSSVSPAVTSSVAATLLVDTNQSAKAFQIAGSSLTPVAPGAGSPIDLMITNPNNQPIRITNLGVTVQGTSTPQCPASQFTVRQYAGSYPLTVPANSAGVKLTSLGVPVGALPVLGMVNSTTDQSACKSITVTLAYTGSATNQ